MIEFRVNMIQYVTDSPVNQYRNKFFWLLSCHKEIFGVLAQWLYSETGHGKGAPDGIGGTVKRRAEQASKHGVPMADALQFIAWAMSVPSATTFVYASKVEYDNSYADYMHIKSLLEPLHGTYDLHHVMSGEGHGHVKWRRTSCTCPACQSGGSTECLWEDADVIKKKDCKQNIPIKTECVTCEHICLT